MCEPVSLTMAATAIAAAGTMVSAVGQSQQARYQAGIADQNVKLANGQARDSIDNTNIEAQRRYREQSRLQGQQTASMAANGVDLSFGSAADVAKDTTMIGAEDVSQIYKAGNERTKGYEINAFNYRSQAAASRSQAKGAIISGVLSTASTVLGGASQVSKMKKPVT